MADTIRERIMVGLCDRLIQHPEIRGVTDDQPADLDVGRNEYESPPRPRIGTWGQPFLPFGFVYELEEQPGRRWTNIVNPTLPIMVEVAFNYGAEGKRLKPEGRRLIGIVERALRDNWRMGGLVLDLREVGSAIEESPTEGHGIAIVQWEIEYSRSLDNPEKRGGEA